MQDALWYIILDIQQTLANTGIKQQTTLAFIGTSWFETATKLTHTGKDKTILALIGKLLSRSCLPVSLHLPAHCTAPCHAVARVKCYLEILPQVLLEQVLLNFLNRFSWSAGCRADYLVLRVQNINKIRVMLVNGNRGLRRSAS